MKIMNKLTKKVSIITIICILIIVNSCTKEELSTNENTSFMQKQQKWNPIENDSFILPDYMQPFQYAVCENDLDNLFVYMNRTLEKQEDIKYPGFFILSRSIDNTLFYWGFLTKTNPQYHLYKLKIPDDDMCFTTVSKRFDNFKDAHEWGKAMAKEGCEVHLNYNKATGEYLVIAHKG